MKVKVRWTYAFMTEHTFEEVVDVPDNVITAALENYDCPQHEFPTRTDVAEDLAWDAAQRIPNGDLTPIKTSHPGDPVDDLEWVEVAETPEQAAVPARIRSRGEDDDPALLCSTCGCVSPEPGAKPGSGWNEDCEECCLWMAPR